MESYVRGKTHPPLLQETIGENLSRIAKEYSDSPALIVPHQNYRKTYGEFLADVEEVARALLAHHIAVGTRVGVWSPNRFEWVLLQYATAKIGAILVNINPAYRSQELSFALHQSGIELLFHSQGFRNTPYQPILDATPTKPSSICCFEKDWKAFLKKGESINIEALRDRESELSPKDPINIQYTSGTTGQPKGATLTHLNILNNGYLVGERLGYTNKDRVCIPVPFYHCFGMVLGNLACTSHGSAMIIPGEAFEPEQTLRTVAEEKCTALYGVPTMFIAELDLPSRQKYDLTTLRTGIMAGATCPVEVMKRVRTELHIPEITICYGMTETSPVSTQTLRSDSLERQVETVGTALPHTEVKIVCPDTGATQKTGETGEFCAQGFGVMAGYWNAEEATRDCIDSQGWMHSGDLAVMDDHGYVRIVGRLKDMIIRGGENIYPREVEEFLYTHPEVAEAQVIGISSSKYGEEVAAWIQRRKGASISGKDLEEYCKGRIATFKIPRHWKFVDAFPMTVTGKIRKVEMREIMERERLKPTSEA